MKTPTEFLSCPEGIIANRYSRFQLPISPATHYLEFCVDYDSCEPIKLSIDQTSHKHPTNHVKFEYAAGGMPRVFRVGYAQGANTIGIICSIPLIINQITAVTLCPNYTNLLVSNNTSTYVSDHVRMTPTQQGIQFYGNGGCDKFFNLTTKNCYGPGDYGFILDTLETLKFHHDGGEYNCKGVNSFICPIPNVSISAVQPSKNPLLVKFEAGYWPTSEERTQALIIKNSLDLMGYENTR